MKRFTIKRTARFERHFFSMPDRLGISKAQALEAVLEMKEAVAILEELGTLPPEYGYNLHQLERGVYELLCKRPIGRKLLHFKGIA